MTRVVRPQEIQRFLVATVKEPEIEQCYLLLLLSTGAQKKEACCIKWTDIDCSTGIWQKPSAKTIPHSVIIPLSLLNRLKQLPPLGSYVFMDGPSRKFSLAKANTLLGRVRSRAGLDHVRFHDLRRTCLSIAAMNRN